jgi:hypothetical protein|tara:strand:+ start:186 stop:599 length:414 start_codon:yes stop_codon:yes gene_type:complete
MIPSITNGNSYSDFRGKLYHNNSFDLTNIKRIYVIENASNFIRRWQGHKTEQRWFYAIKGRFEIKLIKIDNWDKPSKHLKKIIFNIADQALDVLHIPAGYITSIESLTKEGKLLVMSDYKLGVISDDYKFPADTFKE